MCEKSSGYRFGYEVVPAGNRPYESYDVLYLPAAAGQLTGDLTEAEVRQSGQIVKRKPKHRKGRYVRELWFDRGDPLGTYKFEIFADEKRIGAVEFQVVAAKACP